MKYGKILKLGVSIFFLVFLALQINFEELSSALSSIDLFYFLLVLPLPFIGHIFMSGSWCYILDKNWREERTDFFRFLLSLIAVNSVIPLKMGRASAPILLDKETSLEDIDEGVSASILTTMYYSMLYGLTTLLGALLLLGKVDLTLFVLVIASAGVYLIMSLGLLTIGLKFKLPYRQGIYQFLQNFLPDNYLIDDVSISENFKRHLSWDNFSVYSVSWAITNIPLKFVRVYLLFLALGYTFPEPFYLLFLPVVVYSVTVLPVSFGGIGLVEFSSYMFYASFGVPKGVVASVVILDRLTGYYIPSGVGALFLSRTKLRKSA